MGWRTGAPAHGNGAGWVRRHHQQERRIEERVAAMARTEDLITSYGMNPEFMGRLPIIVAAAVDVTT